MSRVKRLKKTKRKTIVKATVCGLALSLSIASLQALGTYASFTDSENKSSQVSISAGDVDVEIGEGFKNIELENGAEYIKDFGISNIGTLNQKLYLYFDNCNGAKFPNGLTYRLDIRYKGKLIDSITGEELQNKDKIEIKDNGKDFILKPNETLTCTAYMQLNSSDNDLKETDNFNFNLKVKATQIGFKNTGFYDIESQKNELSVAKHKETSNEPQNNKVQAPNKPQAAESSKEEVKVPVKPEVVESTKGEDKEQQGNAQEEQSQKEEVKGQGESQEAESSKEEVEVPKKSDVVNP